MDEFSQPWDDGDGVKGLWPRGGGPRNETLWNQIRERRREHVRLATEWRLAAEADGWVFSPTYQTEPVEHAFRGCYEGFTIQGLARPGDERMGPCGSIHIWGPDGLYVRPPLTYDMDQIRKNARVCQYCKAEDVDTIRMGFAGRTCHTCYPTVRAQVERPGWNN
jgi:hypothetical protein